MPRALLLALALSPLALHAQSAGAVAGLQQDVSALRDEVRLLRAEIEEVKEAQTRIQAANTPAKTASGTSDLSAVNARIAVVEAASTTARKSDKAEIQAELNQLAQRITTLQSGVNKALADQTKQVNEALRSGSTARPTETPATPTTPKPDVAKPVEPPSDMPKTGVRHTVAPGDSVSKIAKKMNSKAAWILAANGLRSNADLKAGAVIFVPQVETAAKSE